MTEETREVTKRETKHKAGAFASQVSFGGAIILATYHFFPEINPDWVPYIPVAAMGAWAWAGSKVRDLVHEYKADGNELPWWARVAVGGLG